jgi:hypothetical protein
MVCWAVVIDLRNSEGYSGETRNSFGSLALRIQGHVRGPGRPHLHPERSWVAAGISALRSHQVS